MRNRTNEGRNLGLMTPIQAASSENGGLYSFRSIMIGAQLIN